MKKLIITTILLSVFTVCASTATFAQTTAITYNGSLSESGLPANGNFDFQFALFDAANGGNQIGSMLTQTNITVTNGSFAATLDFGAAAFPGANRWLQLSVRHTGGTDYEMQLPRTFFASTPYAIRALNAVNSVTADTVTGPVTGNNLGARLSVSNSHPGITNPNPISNLPPAALLGEETSTSDVTAGVIGKANSAGGIGLIGVATGSDATGIFGTATSSTGSTTGVQAKVLSPDGTAIQASNDGNGGALFNARGNGNRQFLVDSQANLTTDGNALIHGRMDVDGHLSVGGNIAVSNLVAVGGVSGSSIGISDGGTINGTLHTDTVTAANLTSGFGSIGGLYTNNAQVYGNVNIDGDLTVGGMKQAVVKLSDGRQIGLYAVESPENWFEDFGTVRLHHGRAWIKLDQTFTKTVNLNIPYKVFLTPNGNCRGLYIAKKSATGFEVREIGGGRSNVTFDYRIIAKRLNYEKERFGVGSPKSETAR